MNGRDRIPESNDVHPGHKPNARRSAKAGSKVSNPQGLGDSVDKRLAQPKLSEAAIQKAIVTYLAALRIDAIAVPNGSHLAGDARSRAMQMNKLKATGMLPGFPDLVLFDRCARRVGLLEVKAEGGKLQPSQEHFAKHIAPAWGWPLAVVRSIEDVTETLAEWGWR